jgi:hypothetical protein
MIYIGKGIGEICKLPCTLCKGCCDLFKNCCAAFGEFWEPIIANPLGNYVIGTWIGMLIAALAAIWGVSIVGDCTDDDLKGQLSGYCLVAIVFAIVHSGMAYYMQRAIIKGLGGKDFKEMTAKEIQEQAGQILLYDVPVCLYSFFCFAAFGVNCWALSFEECAGLDNQPQTGTAMVMICWGLLAGVYLCCWYCCLGCQGTFNNGTNGGEAPPTTVGNSA